MTAAPGALAESRPPGFSTAALTRTIRAGIRKANIPGVIVGVWQKDKQLYRQAIGVRNRVTRQPMTTNLGTRIGSVTKSFVVTGILQLVDRGKVGLDDPIAKYVPGVPNGNQITVRELAAMRSGLYNYTAGDFPKILASNPARQWSPSEVLNIAFSQPPLFTPGTAFDYSNTNTVLLGLVIEKVSGQPLSIYLKQNILRPLGLRHTFLPSGAEFPSPHSQGYTKLDAAGLHAA